jgi:hypothetical protein
MGFTMFRLLAAAILSAVPSVAAAQGFSEIRFAPGASSGEVTGQVSDGRPICFTFGSGAGQQARIQLLGSRNACFGVRGIADCRDDLSFRTDRRTYAIDVFQLFLAPGAEDVRLRLTIR